jgi:site-specific DNA-cytosine methylase
MAASGLPEPSLRSWAEFCWNRLPKQQQSSLARVASPLTLGTACSGTDCAVPVFQAIASIAGLAVDHRFSCENEPAKQAWIRGNWPELKTVFDDVRMLGSGSALNVVSGRSEPVPAVDWFVAGFVCKSISMENTQRQQYANCIENSEGQTGETFTGVMRYVLNFCPSIVVLENVEGLLKRVGGSPPPMEGVQSAFLKAGYSFGHCTLDPREFFLPHRRRRVWMWAFRGPDACRRCNSVAATIDLFRCEMQPVMDSILSKAALVGDTAASTLTDRQWAVVDQAQELLLLQRGPRGPGELVDLIVDVAKSTERAARCVGASPCLTTNSLPYRCLTCRVLSPLEALACQGIFREDFVLLGAWAADPKKANLLRNLAGNSFASSVCLAVVFACMVA